MDCHPKEGGEILLWRFRTQQLYVVSSEVRVPGGAHGSREVGTQKLSSDALNGVKDHLPEAKVSLWCLA